MQNELETYNRIFDGGGGALSARQNKIRTFQDLGFLIGYDAEVEHGNSSTVAVA